MRVRKNKRQHKKFDYLNSYVSYIEKNNFLKDKGLQGWELLNFENFSNGYILMFKREIL